MVVPVTGEYFDTQELASWFPQGDIFAVEDSGQVYLTGPAFEDLTDPSDVEIMAAAALDERAAVVALLVPNFRKPMLCGRIITEDKDGSRHTHILFSGSAVARAKAQARLTVSDKDDATETFAELLLRIMRTKRRLHEAILLWSDQDCSWPHFSRIVEEIEWDLTEDLGSPTRRKKRSVSDADINFCSARKRTRFTQTANTEAAGRDARHARGTSELPKQPMSLTEGREFIRELLLKAVRRYAIPTEKGDIHPHSRDV
jgi:hypothetical protein